MLDVRRTVVQQALTLAQIGAQCGQLALGSEAGAQQPIFVEPPQPLGVADVGLASRHVLGVAGVDQHHLESALLKQFVGRYPIDAGGLHGDRSHTATLEPIGKCFKSPVQVPKERTGTGSRSGGTAATCILEPISIAAALGWVGTKSRSGLSRFDFIMMPPLG